MKRFLALLLAVIMLLMTAATLVQADNVGADLSSPANVGADLRSPAPNIDENIDTRQKLQEETEKYYYELEKDIHLQTENGEENPKNYVLATAIANTNGNFTQIQAFENLSDARQAFLASEDSNAVILDKTRHKGNQVIFMKDGIVIATAEKVNKSTLEYGYSYIVNGTDAFYLGTDDNGQNISLAISGQEGQVTINQVELVPRAHTTSQSYYVKNSSGNLVHSISNHRYSTGTRRYDAITTGSVTLEVAPDFMEQGHRYYSKDGENFYSDPQLNNLAGTHYVYFKNLPFRSKTSYTGDELNAYIDSWNRPDSVLIGKGPAFKEAEANFGINAGMLLSLAGIESGRGTSRLAKEKNNIFGIAANDSNPYEDAFYFESVEACINYAAHKFISQGYLDAQLDGRYFGPQLGDKKSGLNVKYASDPFWGEKISGFYRGLDAYLGGKDFNKYQLALSTETTPAYSEAATSSPILYHLKNRGGNYPNNIPILITGSNDGWYRVQSDMAKNEDGQCHWTYDYSFEDKVYTISSKFKTINTPSKPFVDPETEDIQGVLDRLAGATRFETSSLVSQYHIENTDTIILANGRNYPDALAGSTLAAQKNAPILLIEEDEIPTSVMEEINRLNPSKIYLLGGYLSIDKTIEDDLKENWEIERIQGGNRFTTAIAIGQEVRETTRTDTAIIVSGEDFPDAMIGGSIGGEKSYPILFTDSGQLNQYTRDILIDWDIDKVLVIGGPLVLGDRVIEDLEDLDLNVERIQGGNRYLTSLDLALKQYPDTKTIVIAQGLNFPDALVGGSLAAKEKAPILLVEKDTINQEILDYIINKKIKKAIILGGHQVISQDLEQTLRTIIE